MKRKSPEDNFDGNLEELRGFLLRAKACLRRLCREKPEATEKEKVDEIIDRLTGQAAEWIATLEEKGDAALHSAEGLLEVISERYRSPITSADAGQVLQAFEKGGLTVEEYVPRFQELEGICTDWTEGPLIATFLAGLNPEITKQVRLNKPEPTIAAHFTEATHVESILALERKKARTATVEVKNTLAQVAQPPKAAADRHFTWNKSPKRCRLCRQVGHIIADCPLNPLRQGALST